MPSFDITVAKDGAEGVSLAATDPFDLILMDLNLPAAAIHASLHVSLVCRQGGAHDPGRRLTARGDDREIRPSGQRRTRDG